MSEAIEPTVIDLEPQSAEVEQLEKTPPVAENAEEASKDEADKPSDENKAEKTFTQAELDAIVQKRITKLERKLERQSIEHETRAKVLQEVRATPEPSSTKPNPENFTDYADYQEALTDWKVDEKLKQIDTKRNQESTQKQQEAESSRIREREQELLEAGERKYDDFEDVVKKANINISRAAYLSVLESDISADIFYHLSTHADEAKRISELPPFAQAKEVGKLEDKLMAKQPPKVSNAPKPIEPIGNGSSTTKTTDDMSPEEYIKHRLKQKPKWA
jgi:vacuolar-type H+-ATPase subunit I/STV1